MTISSKAADINVDGNIGSNCRFITQSGDINVGDVGNNSTLKTISGDVNARNVGTNCSLITTSGNVMAEDVRSHSTLSTVSGDVRVQNADESVSLKTISGDIYENGVKRKRKKAQGVSFSISSGNRFFVNGRDITDLVHANSLGQPAPTNEARYSSTMDISMMVLGGFIAAMGIFAVAIAFVALNASTFGIGGVVMASLGFAAICSGAGLFAAGAYKNSQTFSEDSLGFSGHIVPSA